MKILFLGAGASKDSNYPLAEEIFNELGTHRLSSSEQLEKFYYKNKK